MPVGTGHYLAVFDDPVFWRALGVSVRFTVLSVVLTLAIGLGLGLIVSRRFPGAALVRTLIILPWGCSLYGTGIMFSQLSRGQTGLLTWLSYALGFDEPVNLITGAWVVEILALGNAWNLAPLVGFFLGASIAAIPRRLYDMAVIDRLGPVARFVHVTLTITIPFVTWMLIGCFRRLPAIEGLARVDGMGRLTTFAVIFVPMARTGIAVAAVIAFLFSWNEYTYAQILVNGTPATTMPAAISGFLFQNPEPQHLSAALVVTLLPRGDRMVACVRPHDMEVDRHPRENALPARVFALEHMGRENLLIARPDALPAPVNVVVPPDWHAAVGDTVHLAVPRPVALVFADDGTVA